MERSRAADLDLARRCAAGEPAAWDRFVLEYRPVLYRAADALDRSGGAREVADSLYAELYGLKDRNAWLLPAFQFVADGLVPNIEEVLKRLPEGLSPLALARWLMRQNPDLCTRDDEERPLSPRQWLLEGNPPEPVAELAAAL